MLVAFPYLKGSVMTVYKARHDKRTRLLIDSGAFTAWKSGNPIALDDYCRFLETLPVEPWRYFALDVVGDPAGTMRNYEAMLKRGFKPMPIFTRGEDPSVLEDYYRTSDMVGVGGLVGTEQNRGFVNGIMKHIAGRRVHLLGFNKMDYLRFWKPYAADSSNHTVAHRYGSADVYCGAGRFKRLVRSDIGAKLDASLAARIGRYGLDPYALGRADQWRGGGSLSGKITKCSWVEFMLDVEQHLGVRFFLSETDSLYLEMIFDAFEAASTLRRPT